MRRMLLAAAAAATATLALAGCSGGSTPTSSTNGGTHAASAAPTTGAYGATEDTALAKTLPASVRSSGDLTVGGSLTYPSAQFKDAAGNPVGWEIDLVHALGTVLGLKVDFTNATFSNILPSVSGGRYDIGIASFTDTAVREKQVDFVDYYSSGIRWATRPGEKVNPADACGLRVGAGAGTTELLQELPAKSKACTAAGKKPIQIMTYESSGSAVSALTLGQIDAYSADSPTVDYALLQAHGKIVPAGGSFDTSPYGIAIQKGSPLVPVIKNAVQTLIDDGVYGKILKKWEVQDGAITTVAVNGAASH